MGIAGCGWITLDEGWRKAFVKLIRGGRVILIVLFILFFIIKFVMTFGRSTHAAIPKGQRIGTMAILTFPFVVVEGLWFDDWLRNLHCGRVRTVLVWLGCLLVRSNHCLGLAWILVGPKQPLSWGCHSAYKRQTWRGYCRDSRHIPKQRKLHTLQA